MRKTAIICLVICGRYVYQDPDFNHLQLTIQMRLLLCLRSMGSAMNNTNTLRNDLNSITLVFTATNKPMKANRKTIDTFLHILSEVKDFRQEGKTVYKLENLLFICFYLSLKGEFTSFKHIADYVQVKQNRFIRRKLIERGKISHAISTCSISTMC